MAESKIRVKHTQSFTTVFNSVLRDQRLSLKTLGLYVIMQSFPDDWEYSIRGLAARCRIGRDAIRKCLRKRGICSRNRAIRRTANLPVILTFCRMKHHRVLKNRIR